MWANCQAATAMRTSAFESERYLVTPSRRAISLIASTALARISAKRSWRQRYCQSETMNPIGHDRITCARDLLQRLDTNHDAVVVDVPDGDWIGRVVDPGAPVVRDRLGQDILCPAIGLGIETHDAARIHLARPDLTVLVGQAFVE